ncbi:hypothetical protein [Nocardia abscessus]|uniref:hypothetical protein n=1 Tax=Nocardia abscessus TaxID=120957 RepID=UPI002453E3EE|nr:hypothetical protein [Nocardia abscessus]
MTNPFTVAETPDHSHDPAEPDPATTPVALEKTAAAAAVEPGGDNGRWPPLWWVMPVTAGSGASTLDRWCACSREVGRDPAWRPPSGQSPYLVLTTPKTVEGIRRARQLAGALTSTTPGSARVAAIVALAEEPSSRGGGGIQLKEMIAAAEAAGVKIITCDYSPDLAGQLVAPAGAEGWSPRALNPTVPNVLARVYIHVFFIVADREAGSAATKEVP